MGHIKCFLLHSLQSHPKNLWEKLISHSYLISLGKSKLVFQATQLSFYLSNPFHFSSSAQNCVIILALKRYLEKSLPIVKKDYFPLSTGMTQDYLSVTEEMWNSSLQLCKHYRNPRRGHWWSVGWHLACFVQSVCLVLNWMATHILFPSATRLWDGSTMKKEDRTKET